MKKILLCFLIVSTVSCTKIYNDNDLDDTRAGSLTGPSAIVEKADLIEFRVFGSSPVTIRHSTSLDGTTVNSGTVLPYYSSIETKQSSVFLFIEATIAPSSVPLIPAPAVQVQIFVNGRVFREAYSTTIAQVSGTYRRPNL